MSNDIVVKAQKRSDVGSSAVARLRRTGWIPAVVYSAKKDALAIQLDDHDFELMLSRHGSESMMIELDIADGAKEQVLLREVQHHPVDGHVLHADFHAVDMHKKLVVNIPIELTGTPKGVVEGGVLDQSLWDVEVECLPGDIVEQLVLDVSGLEIGDNLTVADIGIDTEKYEIMTEPEISVASVAPPRKLEEEQEPEEGLDVSEGPEVIGEEDTEQEQE